MSFVGGSSGLSRPNAATAPLGTSPPSGASSPAQPPSLSDWSDLNNSLVATETGDPAPQTNECIHLLPELEAGIVLIGNPKHTCSSGPHLHHAVILVLGYDPDYGTIGVSLNCTRQTQPPTAPLELGSVPLHVGGSCCTDEIVALYRTPEGQRDFPGTFMKGLSFIFGFGSILHAVTYGQVDKESVRMYYNRQDWDHGELEAEVENGYWCIAAVSSNYVFDLKPLDIYHRLVRELDLG